MSGEKKKHLFYIKIPTGRVLQSHSGTEEQWNKGPQWYCATAPGHSITLSCIKAITLLSLL